MLFGILLVSLSFRLLLGRLGLHEGLPTMPTLFMGSTFFSTDNFVDSAQLRRVILGLNLLTRFLMEGLMSEFLLSVALQKEVSAAVATPGTPIAAPGAVVEGAGKEFLSLCTTFFESGCPDTD